MRAAGARIEQAARLEHVLPVHGGKLLECLKGLEGLVAELGQRVIDARRDGGVAGARDKAIAFEAEDLTVACARTSATVIRTLKLRPEVARAAASGLLLATEVADYLVGRGMPFRTAHEVTGRIVRDLYADRKDFSELSLADWRKYHELFEDGIFQVITPEAAVAARRTPQSTNPVAVSGALADLRRWLDGLRVS